MKAGSAHRANLNDAAPVRWDDARRGQVSFRVLLSSDLTPSHSLVKGIVDLAPNECERLHRHDIAESVLVLEGCGEAEIDGVRHVMSPGDVFFLPAGCWHEWRTEDQPVRFVFVFPADTLEDVAYIYPEDA